MKAKLALTTVVILACIPALVHGQSEIGLPDASQAAQVKQRIGVADVTITYHRPLVNGRKVWGALVPFGQVWRAGANENTTFEVSEPVFVEDKPLAKGVYGLHMIPTADTWTIIFSKAATSWGSYTYSESEDALRVTVKPRPVEMEEALEYEFEDLKPDSAMATLKWEKLAVPFRVSVTDEQTTLPFLRNQLRGRAQYSWGPLNEAAQYCLTKKVALDEGLKWAEQSVQTEERFENLSTKAELLQAMNRADDAKKARTHALEIATPGQLYSRARQLQQQKRDGEAMELFQAVVKRAPQDVFGHLAQSRIKSAAGDFDGALAEAKTAQSVAPSEQQKAAIKGLIDRLQAKQDINK
jgi:hypothetical protein